MLAKKKKEAIPEPKEEDVMKVKQIISTLGSAFVMAAAPMRPQLQQKGMDVQPALYYPDEGNAVYLGLKLVFPDEAAAKYFMECAKLAKEGEE